MTGARNIFDEVADTYDRVGVPWFSPVAARLVAELAPQPGERALDVGCGAGAALLPLAEAVGSGGSALGVDPAPRMVARAAAAVSHLPQAGAVVGDARVPDLADASLDVVAASLVLFFLPDPAAALARWRELLGPGGRVGVSTFGEQDPRWVDVEAGLVDRLPAGTRDARTTGRTVELGTDDGVAGLLRAAGLQDVRTVHQELSVRFTSPEHWLAFSRSHGQRAMWDAVPEADTDAVREDVLGRLGALRARDGTVTLRQQVRHTVGRR
ncbi:hypothetical protein GCM10027047_25140 [Rhodococcus aerolatus]